MKNILFISAILLMSLSSCEDYLEVETTNAIAIRGIEDVKALQAASLLSLKTPVQYPYVSYLQRPAGNHFFYPSGTDNTMFAYYTKDMSPKNFLTQNGYYLPEKFFKDCMKWNTTSYHSLLWTANYENIGFQNEIIYELENLGLEKNYEWKVCYAEAKIMRAYLIFKTFQYFSTFQDPESGIPLNLNPQNIVGAKKTRWTQQEIYDQVILEFQDIIDLDLDPDLKYNVMYRRDIVDAMLAQIYLYKGTGPCKEETDWANARTHAEKASVNRYLTTSFEELDDLFTTNTLAGEVEYNNPGAAIIFNWGTKNGTGTPSLKSLNSGIYFKYSERYAILPHTEFIDLLDENDYRTEKWFDEYTYDDPSVHTVTMANKVSFQGYYVYTYNPMFRTAEMKLIIAETYAREGDDGKAKAALQEFKNSRNAGEYAGETLAEILKERRKEFFCEGDYRWLDMKRNGMTLTNEYETKDGAKLSFDLASDDFRYAFKIPVREELTHNFELTQNPGWDTFNE